jgi:hypothetical protein
VDYRVADLLHPPSGFRHAFDFVFESLTIQSLPPDFHPGALASIANFAAPGGTLLLFCRGRNPGEHHDGPPWPLAKTELEALQRHGLTEVSFKDWVTSDVRRFLAEYTRGRWLLDDLELRTYAKTLYKRAGVKYLLPNMPHTRDDYLEAVSTSGLTILEAMDIPHRELPAGYFSEEFMRMHCEKMLCLILLAQKQPSVS